MPRPPPARFRGRNRRGMSLRLFCSRWISPGRDHSKPPPAHWPGKANYELSVAGKPASPVLVTLEGSQVPLITLFREAGLQAGARATLRVSPERRLIEVIYAE